MNQTFYGCASITTGQRAQIIDKQGIPGPGTYDPSQEDQKRIPMWSLKPKIEYTSCFHNSKQFVPAPGAYNLNATNVRIKQLQSQMGKKRKQVDIKNTKYKDRNYIQKSSPIIALQIPSFIQDNIGHSFGYRDQIVVKQLSPGPIYHINERLEENRKKKNFNSSTGFGFGDRNKIDKCDSPGPGNYSPSPQKMYNTSNRWTFSKSPRKDKFSSLNPTGPGEYNPQIFNTSRSFKLKGRYKQIKNQESSACPGSYQLPDTKSKRGAVFKAMNTGDKRQNQLDNGPSPFSYDPIASTLKSNGYSLGKKLIAIDQNIENPGPGSYQIKQKIEERPGGYMSRKIETKKKGAETQDNFYKYNPKTQIVNYKYPQFSFKQSPQIKTKQSSNLGPGSYYINKQFVGQSYSIGKQRRFKPLNKQKSFGNLLAQKNYYSSIGYLPGYLKNNKKSINELKSSKLTIDEKSIQQKQN